MVKFFYSSPITVSLKYAFNKSFWVKIKTLYAHIQEHNPTVAFFVVPAWPVMLAVAGVVGYMKYNCDTRPKYFERYLVMRSDDPRVEDIRHDDSLRIEDPYFRGILSTAQ